VKTDDLVRLLAADATVEAPPGRQLIRAAIPAMAVALALYLALAGVREDVAQALSSPRFILKLLVCAALAATATGALLRAARPQPGLGRWGAWLGLPAAVLVVAVASELLLLPARQWAPAAIGHNATICLRLIPTLAAAPLIASLLVLRRAAPSRPALAGAVAGLMSAGIGALLYATHCTDDSPLFVAIWYGCATAIVVAIGAVAGARLLRW
jgi:hypothetical protein